MAKDYTKYNVKGLGENLNKRHLVFTVVKDWARNKNPSFEDMQIAFPKEIQGSKGFILKKNDVTDAQRFNMQEPLSIKGGTQVVVSNQWGTKNIGAFLKLAEKLGYSVTPVASKSSRESGFSEEDIAVLTETNSGFEFEEALKKALGKAQLDALDYEPILIEMVNKNTLQGQSFNMSVATIAGWVNLHFGNLCYRAYYKEEGITKSNFEYAATWGKLVTTLAERAETDVDYINVASCVQMQFTAFEDKDECMQFAHENYSNAIDAMDDVQQLVALVGGHLQEEYYENEELTEKAGMKALASASTFQDFAYICFDDSERCLFNNTDIYKTAATKAVKLKDQADEYDMEHFKRMLEEWEDEETLKLF